MYTLENKHMFVNKERKKRITTERRIRKALFVYEGMG